MSTSISRFCIPMLLTPLFVSGCGLIEDTDKSDRSASGGQVIVEQAGPSSSNWHGLNTYTSMHELPIGLFRPEGKVVRSTFGTYRETEDGPIRTSHQSGMANLDARYNNRTSGLTHDLNISEASPELAFGGITQGHIGSTAVTFETFNGPEGSSETLSNIVVTGDSKTYTKLGVWNDQKLTSGHGDTAFITYGQRTNSADMPNGTATFTGKAVGIQSYVPRDYDDGEQVVQERMFTGNVNLFADFGERVLYGGINELSANSSMGIDEISINAQIIGSGFSGDAYVSDTSEWATGHTEGMFYGPGTDEQELGGVFILESRTGNGDVITGGFTAGQ